MLWGFLSTDLNLWSIVYVFAYVLLFYVDGNVHKMNQSFCSSGGDHQAKAWQGSQEDSWAQGQVPTGTKGEGQIQGGNHWENAGVKWFFC